MAVVQQSLILRLIERAVLAGAYRALARQHPASPHGFLRLAGKYSAEVADLVAQVRDEPFTGDDTP